MWTRSELKNRGKAALKRNYWKAVLVAALLAVAVGGTVDGNSSAASFVGPVAGITTLNTASDDDTETYVESYDEPGDPDEYEDPNAIEENHPDEPGEHIRDYDPMHDLGFVLPALLIVLLVVVLLVGLPIAITIFLALPVEVGCQRFFLLNLNRKADVREAAWAFDNSYLNVVKILFVRDLKLLGWSLLLVVPGIYKLYEYRMIPYLLAEDPTMNMDEAFAQSRLLMDGQKWSAFVLDLSFLGWHLLSMLTLGILEVLYVGPYVAGTNAALYETLRYGSDKPEEALPLPAAPVTPMPPEGYEVQDAPQVPAAPAESGTAQPDGEGAPSDEDRKSVV